MVPFFIHNPTQKWARYPTQKWARYNAPPPKMGYHPTQKWATTPTKNGLRSTFYYLLVRKKEILCFSLFSDRQDLMLGWTF